MTRSMVLAEEEAKRIAHAIAFGHAYLKHAGNPAEVGDLLTQSSFESLIVETMLNPAMSRNLFRGRSAYWNEWEQFLVIVDPADPDCGTAYWPDRGVDVYHGLS